MVLTSFYLIRRAVYELFLVVHMLFPVVVAFIILHVPDTWPGFLPGLVLQAVDLGTRFLVWVRSKRAHVQRYEGVTLLEAELLHEPRMRGGEYYFVNIPVISPLEWHPFSVSGATVNSISFHIKAHHRGSWTYNLNQISSDSVVVNLDGPYGKIPLDLYSYECILIIVGGIGITPYLVLIEHLLSEPECNNLIRRISLNWTLRLASLYNIFVPKLEALLVKGGKIDFVVNIYNNVGDEPVSPRFPMTPGRLNVNDTLCSMVNHYPNMCCLICGPEQLVSEAMKCSNALGIDFHSEIFHY